MSMLYQKTIKKELIHLITLLLSVLFLSLNSYSQCSASFTVVDNGNGSYTFTNTSTGTTPNTDFFWEIRFSSQSLPILLSTTSTSFTHTFANGIYPIQLFLSDSSLYCFDSFTSTINVTTGINCNLQASFNHSLGANGLVSFNSTSTGNFNYESWSVYEANANVPTVLFGSTPTYTATTNGNLEVCYTIIDTNTTFCSDTVCSTISITNVVPPPCNINAGFSYIDNGNGNFSFTNTSTNTTFFNWNFGDGNISSANHPNHTYATNGTYVVVLYAHDSIVNCFDIFTQTITVTSALNTVACNAGYSMYLDTITNNVIVTNSATGQNLIYFWNFGDGNTSNLAYPNYTYTTPGPFYLCLTITDSVSNCTDTYCDSIGSNGIVLRQNGFTINVQSPTSTDIEQNSAIIDKINTYPNPFKESISIDVTVTKNTIPLMFITDITGKVIYNFENDLFHNGTNTIKWNADKIENGIYFLTIKTESELKVVKLILAK